MWRGSGQDKSMMQTFPSTRDWGWVNRTKRSAKDYMKPVSQEHTKFIGGSPIRATADLSKGGHGLVVSIFQLPLAEGSSGGWWVWPTLEPRISSREGWWINSPDGAHLALDLLLEAFNLLVCILLISSLFFPWLLQVDVLDGKEKHLQISSWVPSLFSHLGNRVSLQHRSG